MVAGEHALELGRLNPARQMFVHFMNLNEGVLVLGFLPQFYHHPYIRELTSERVPGLDNFFQCRTPFHDVLGDAGIIPETGRRHGGLDFLDGFPLVIYVKETPGAWRYVLPGHSYELLLHGTWVTPFRGNYGSHFRHGDREKSQGLRIQRYISLCLAWRILYVFSLCRNHASPAIPALSSTQSQAGASPIRR